MREPLIPHDAAQTLAAAGIAPLAAKLPAEERTTPIAARAYPHPGLDGKIIVRLESEAVAEGVDAEMAAFGFEAPKVSTVLGKVRYRTLGFPAWGLVNVPKTAKVALGVMEDVRKAKRMVAAKPGHAKEAFEKIAKTLQKASPQLLPSFWEEVGRVVADQASATMAAQCFERARQAERAFKLSIDADDCDAVFVEFALLGALSAKSLSQYAKDLAKAEGGAQAYKRFRSIAVKRALGGMPPWSGMGKDVRSLAEDAGLDLDKEDEALVAELLDAPAIGKAPMEFWTTYHDALLRLAKGNAAVRTRLRALWPDPSGGTRDQRTTKREAWVALLDEVGAFGDLPDDGLGAWISRLISYVGPVPRVIALLRELAPRLKAQPIEVRTSRNRWSSGLNLDLAELAIELGIPLADPVGEFSAESMNCDPVRVAAHPTYGPKLIESVAEIIGEPEHEHRMRGKPGFDAARKAWISGQLDKLGAHPLSCSIGTIDTLESKTTAEMFLPFPDQWERLRAMELAGALAAQLRGGIADEFGWQAYEDAFAKLGGEIKVSGCFPILVLYNKSKALAITGSAAGGATGVIAEHDLVYKAKEHEVENVSYVGGQFLVELSPTKGWGRIGYWSGNPKLRHEKLALGEFGIATTLADGSVTCSGGKSFRAGDAETSGNGNYFVEGSRFWKYEYRVKDSLRELDPVKGASLGTGMPEFFAKPWAKERKDWRFAFYQSSLYRAPDGLASSPLGVANGQAGVRIRHCAEDDCDYECERVDGLVHTCSNAPGELVVFPGDPKPREADSESASNARFPGGSGHGINLKGDGDHGITINEKDWAARGWGAVHVPPLLWWHFLTPRDVAGSTALRKLTVEQARAILAVARGELAASGGNNDTTGRELPKTQAKIREVLGVTDAKLARGIAGFVELAAEQAARVDTIAAERAKDNADPGGEGLTGGGQKLRKLLVTLHAGRTGKINDFEIEPGEWLEHGRHKAVESLLPFASEDERRVARDMLRAIAMSPFVDDTKGLRVLSISEPDDWSDPEDWNTIVISKQDASTFVVHGSSNWAIEYSTDGTFRAPKPWNVDEARELKTPLGSEWAKAFLALPDEPVKWDPAFATTLAEKSGLSVPEAILLYCGIPTRGYRKDFLGKDKREIVGIKMGEADAARTSFQDIDSDKRTELFAKAVPADASLLRTPLAPDGYIDRLAKAWKQKYGKRAKIPQDLIAAAKKELSLGNDLAKYLPAFAGEDDAEFLKPDMRPLHELGGWRDEHGLTWNTGKELATLIAWLFLQRPVGDSIRNGIPDVVGALVKCVDNAKALWKLDDFYFSDDDAKSMKLRDQLFDLVGGKSTTLPKYGDEECKRAFDDGTIVIGEYGSEVMAGFRPAKLEGAARKKVETLARAMANSEEHTEDTVLQVTRAAALLRSEGFAAFGERAKDTPVAAGKYEADPRESAPKLVAKVAKATGLSTDAAALYLQILALAEPTERNVQKWNGWTAKQYKPVAAELAKKKLVLEGKRERAGRGIFLKGGYSKGDKQDLPMEDWKQPYYTELERHVPAEPCHLLFARVWKRIEDGDKPA